MQVLQALHMNIKFLSNELEMSMYLLKKIRGQYESCRTRHFEANWSAEVIILYYDLRVCNIYNICKVMRVINEEML